MTHAREADFLDDAAPLDVRPCSRSEEIEISVVTDVTDGLQNLIRVPGFSERCIKKST